MVLSQALHAGRGNLPPQRHPVMVMGTGGLPGVILTWDDVDSGMPSAFLSRKCCSVVFSTWPPFMGLGGLSASGLTVAHPDV